MRTRQFKTTPDPFCGLCDSYTNEEVRDYGGMMGRFCTLCDVFIRNLFNAHFNVPVAIEAEISACFVDLRNVA